MVSRELKKSNLHEQLQLLRSITNSREHRKTSIVADASNYIEELKHKIELLNEDIETAQCSNNNSDQKNSRHKVTVETLENGFLVNVNSGKTSPGLLVSILEAFEEMGLNVMKARVSCEDMFLFEAVGEENEENERLDAQYLKQMVSDAIDNWEGSDEQ